MSEWKYRYPAAIHSTLDDAGLPLADFRILCHIYRRSGHGGNGRGCDASVDSIAAVCRVHRDTVRASLKRLRDGGWIRATERPGESTVYFPTVNHPPETKAGVGNEGRGMNARQGYEMEAGHPPETKVGHPPEMEVGKGIPERIPEGKPSKATKKKPSRAEIEEIYQAYPRKTAREEALKAIAKAAAVHDPAMILSKTLAYASAVAWQERQFIPYPSTWFNGKRFLDDPEEWRDPSASKPAKNNNFTCDQLGI
jgi:hypothetical protein